MAIVLGANRYGKAEIRLVRVVRDGPRHELRDLTVDVALAGDLAATHLTGDNAGVLPTDTQKNTVYAFAKKHGVGALEDFGLLLAGHFVDSQPSITWARVRLTEQPWQRLGPHSFAREGAETRTACVTVGGERAWAVAGLDGLVLLNSTGSEFTGFAVDEYTTLPPTTDRVLATEVSAHWRYATTEVDWDAARADVRASLVHAFTATYSLSLQQTLFSMGTRVLEERAEVAEIRLTLPNKHHFLVDLAPFGLDNPGEVFVATDRPYGLIEGTVTRDDAAPADEAW
jgi:urate oxidase